MRTVIAWMIVFICLCANTSAASQRPVVVDVEGFADILGGRKDLARENALNNAFRLAIEQVVGVMINSKTVIQNSQLLHDKIFSKSSGFIKTYAITHESFENGACRLHVRATVSTSRLEKGLEDVKLLWKKMGKPRMALIISEQNIADEQPAHPLQDISTKSCIAETVIYGVLEKKGYNLVDRQTLVAIARQQGAISATDASVPLEAAIRVAAGGGAEIVIIGQSVAKAGATVLSGTNMRSSQAEVTAKVVDADTGQIIASHSASGVFAHINPSTAGTEAIRNASQELAENLHKQIMINWKQRVTGPRTAQVKIKGVEFDDISRLRELMRQRLSSVEETLERGYKDGVLNLEVEINGTPRELAEEVSKTAIENFRIKVLSYTGNTLNLRIMKK